MKLVCYVSKIVEQITGSNWGRFINSEGEKYDEIAHDG